MDSAFIQQRIDQTKAIIIAYEDAVLALTVGGVQSYELDTGQTRQKVTKNNLVDMNSQIDSLYNRCATLEARLNGSGVAQMRPNF